MAVHTSVARELVRTKVDALFVGSPQPHFYELINRLREQGFPDVRASSSRRSFAVSSAGGGRRTATCSRDYSSALKLRERRRRAGVSTRPLSAASSGVSGPAPIPRRERTSRLAIVARIQGADRSRRSSPVFCPRWTVARSGRATACCCSACAGRVTSRGRGRFPASTGCGPAHCSAWLGAREAGDTASGTSKPSWKPSMNSRTRDVRAMRSRSASTRLGAARPSSGVVRANGAALVAGQPESGRSPRSYHSRRVDAHPREARTYAATIPQSRHGAGRG